MNWIYDPWPWYVAGPLIFLTMVLLLLAGRSLGFSANFRVMCAAVGARKLSSYFNIEVKSQSWNLIFLVGAVIGGFIAHTFMGADGPVELAESTVRELETLGFESPGSTFVPGEFFGSALWSNVRMIGLLVLGGFLVGFGSRWANGCTSGHAISGLSNLQLSSLITVIGFFIGGLIMVWFIFPILFT